MNNQSEKPIEEMLRGIPQDHRICIPFQWAEDGRETGHHYIPVGRHVHQAADKITALRKQLAEITEDRFESHRRWDAENAARMRAEAERDKVVAAFSHLQSFVSGDLQEHDAAEVASLINAALKEEGK